MKQMLYCLFYKIFLGDPEKQGDLIKQLQEQHYIQYMQQLQAAQRESSTNFKLDNDDNETANDKVCNSSSEKVFFCKRLYLLNIMNQ